MHELYGLKTPEADHADDDDDADDDDLHPSRAYGRRGRGRLQECRLPPERGRRGGRAAHPLHRDTVAEFAVTGTAEVRYTDKPAG
jgi:hypothetical protein